jgi:hypothetical protein
VATLGEFDRRVELPGSENNLVAGQPVRDFFTAALRRAGVAVLNQVRPGGPAPARRSCSSALLAQSSAR